MKNNSLREINPTEVVYRITDGGSKVNLGKKKTKCYKGSYQGIECVIKKIRFDHQGKHQQGVEYELTGDYKRLFGIDKHENLVGVLGYFWEENDLFIVCPYCKGKSVADRIKLGPVSEKNKSLWVKDIINGLHYLHSIGLLHGNIKLSNILLGEGLTPRAMFSDYGILTAKTKTREEVTKKTDVNQLGKVIWQILNEKQKIVSGNTSGDGELPGISGDRTYKKFEMEMYMLARECCRTNSIGIGEVKKKMDGIIWSMAKKKIFGWKPPFIYMCKIGIITCSQVCLTSEYDLTQHIHNHKRYKFFKKLENVFTKKKIGVSTSSFVENEKGVKFNDDGNEIGNEIEVEDIDQEILTWVENMNSGIVCRLIIEGSQFPLDSEEISLFEEDFYGGSTKSIKSKLRRSRMAVAEYAFELYKGQSGEEKKISEPYTERVEKKSYREIFNQTLTSKYLLQIATNLPDDYSIHVLFMLSILNHRFRTKKEFYEVLTRNKKIRNSYLQYMEILKKGEERKIFWEKCRNSEGYFTELLKESMGQKTDKESLILFTDSSSKQEIKSIQKCWEYAGNNGLDSEEEVLGEYISVFESFGKKSVEMGEELKLENGFIEKQINMMYDGKFEKFIKELKDCRKNFGISQKRLDVIQIERCLKKGAYAKVKKLFEKRKSQKDFEPYIFLKLAEKYKQMVPISFMKEIRDYVRNEQMRETGLGDSINRFTSQLKNLTKLPDLNGFSGSLPDVEDDDDDIFK